MARRRRAIVLFVCAASSAFAASCNDIDLDLLNFACEREGRCRDASSPGDVGLDELDGGDAGGDSDSGTTVVEGQCSPTIEETTIDTRYWWCRNMTTDELRAFTERFGAKILDIEAEENLRGALFTAALERKETGVIADWAEDLSRGDITAFNQNGLELIDTAALEVADQRIRFAAGFEYLPGSRYWGDSSPAENIGETIVRVLDDDNWRAPSYGPRVVDLSRWSDGATERFIWLAKVRGTQRISEIFADRTQEEIEALAATKKILDIERTAFNDRFTVVTATRAPSDPEMHFIYAALPSELDDALAEHAAHVRRIAPHRFGSTQRWSAVIVQTATSAGARVLERIGDHSAGEAAYIFAAASGGTGGSTLAASREHALWRAGQFSGALIALYTFQRLSAGAVRFDDAIPNYPGSSSGCPSTRPSGTVTIREALQGMLTRWENDKTKALVLFFGERAIEAWADARGFDAPMLEGSIGCTNHTTQTTLADGVRIFRAMSELRADLRDDLYAMMLGPNPDPGGESDVKSWDYAAIFPEIVKEETHRAGIAPAVRDYFAAQINFRYARGVRATTGNFHDAGFIAVAELPRCESGTPVHDTFIYGAALTGASTTRDSNRGLSLNRAELFRQKIRESLATFDCAP